MKCHDCGAKLQKTVTDLPFKRSVASIIILKKLPVFQCENCSQFLIEDATIARVDELLNGVDESTELEIRSYTSSSGHSVAI